MCNTPHCIQDENKEPLIIAKCPKCDCEIDCSTFIDNNLQLPKIKCECGANVVPDLYINGELAKQCRGECGEIKLLEEFYDEKNGKYGCKGSCKKCFNKQKKKYQQSPEGKKKAKTRRKKYNSRPDVREKQREKQNERNKDPNYRKRRSEYNKEYKQRPDVIARNEQQKEENRRKGSGQFANLNLPKLEWDRESGLCPLTMNGQPLDIDAAQKEGNEHIVYVFIARDGKGIIFDNSHYGGRTNLITNKHKTYVSKTQNPAFVKYLKKHKNCLERHVIALVKNENEAAAIEMDLLDHDDGTGIPRWHPSRKDWLNLRPGQTTSTAPSSNFNNYSESDVERFEAKINKNGIQTEYVDTPCWNWAAGKDNKGYGMARLNGKQIRAHRASKIIYNNYEFQKDECANHLCHNPSCVNPDHIYVGTKKENMQDMANAGRNLVLKGEDNPRSTLTWKKVRELRAEFATGKYTQAEMCRKHDMPQGWLGAILRNESWKE